MRKRTAAEDPLLILLAEQLYSPENRWGTVQHWRSDVRDRPKSARTPEPEVGPLPCAARETGALAPISPNECEAYRADERHVDNWRKHEGEEKASLGVAHFQFRVSSDAETEIVRSRRKLAPRGGWLCQTFW